MIGHSNRQIDLNTFSHPTEAADFRRAAYSFSGAFALPFDRRSWPPLQARCRLELHQLLD